MSIRIANSFNANKGLNDQNGKEAPSGFDVMQDVAHQTVASAVRQAMYWCAPDRTYRLTKNEQNGGTAVCPHCKADMEREGYTRSEKMYRCSECGFKIPTGKVTTKKVEIEIEPDGEVEIEVSASLTSRRK
jgi:predicted RNA-binding Zn-ribbon protein involved in translation (DUF1610 family)